MPSYHCSDNVSVEWNKGNQAFKLYIMSELITHMPSYHCSDNVSITWNKGNQAFKLCGASEQPSLS